MAKYDTNDIPIYIFSGKEIYCFSDLEGSIPNLFPQNAKKGTAESVEQANTVINILNGTKELEENQALVFTGDLLDRGPHGIKLMQRFIDLKNKNANQVLLCAGNRDFNKIRMFDEFFAVNENTNLPPWFDVNGTIIEDFGAVLNNVKNCKYAFNAYQLQGPLVTKNKGELKSTWSDFTEEKFKTIFSENLTKRVNEIYGNTLGAIQYVNTFAEEEMKSVFQDIRSNQNQKQISPQNTTNLVPAFIIVMNMIMGCEWPVAMIPKCLENYNGLYIKYLNCCHVIAAFKNENVYALVSHSGVPYVGNEFVIPDSIGKTSTNGNNIIKGLEALQNEKLQFLSEYSKKTFFIFNVIVSALNQQSGVLQNVIKSLKDSKTFQTVEKHTQMSKIYIGLTTLIQSINSEISALKNRYKNVNNQVVQVAQKQSTNLPNKYEYEAIRTNFLLFDRYVKMTASVYHEDMNSNYSPITTISLLKDKGPKQYKQLSLKPVIPDNVEKQNIYLNIFGHQPAGYVPFITKHTENDEISYYVDLDISKAESLNDANKNSIAVLVVNTQSINVTGFFQNNRKTYHYEISIADFAKGVGNTSSGIQQTVQVKSNTGIANVTLNFPTDKIFPFPSLIQKL